MMSWRFVSCLVVSHITKNKWKFISLLFTFFSIIFYSTFFHSKIRHAILTSLLYTKFDYDISCWNMYNVVWVLWKQKRRTLIQFYDVHYCVVSQLLVLGWKFGHNREILNFILSLTFLRIYNGDLSLVLRYMYLFQPYFLQWKCIFILYIFQF